MSSKPERYGDLTREERIEDSDEYAVASMQKELTEIYRKRRQAIAKNFHINSKDLAAWAVKTTKEKLKHG